MLFNNFRGNPKRRFFSYFIYARGELALVILGILIALQINN